jgi:hypothetical protein
MSDRSEKKRNYKQIRLTILLFGLGILIITFLRVKHAENWVADWAQQQTVVVVLLIPSLLNEDERQLVDNTNSLLFLGDEDATFSSLEKWFQEEYQRFDKSQTKIPFRFEIKGPFQATRPSPRPPSSGKMSLLERYNKVRLFLNYYDEQQQAHNITGSNIVFVSFYHKIDSSFYKNVHSVADRRSHRGFVFAPMDDESSDLVLINVAHEMLHLFGATDKYVGQTCEFPIGYYDPYQSGLFPQQYAEVMAQAIPLAKDKERLVKYFDEMRIGMDTAWQIGWIPKSRRDRYYKGNRSLGPHDD